MTAAEEPPRRRGRPPSGGREAILEAALAVLREHGIAHLTSREVAARAGVSDASVYYHFRDRAGLLQAMFEHGMKPLLFLQEVDRDEEEPRTVLRQAAASLEAFFDDVLPILHAAQSDAELRPIVAGYIERKDVGPHRGVEHLAGYLRAQQGAGRISPRADPEAVAMLLIDSSFARCVRRHMLIRSEERLPSREALLDEISRLLDPS
ncbi:MAG TPA: helix-turn-helix domain-containing protein [Solirubrobacteraceae bacterium]|nr:helix-turn-helix domain-containing protein [Solirubrobacteraceae bacterium]